LDGCIDRERWRHCRGCRDVGQRNQWDVRRIVGELRDLLVLILEAVEDTVAATRHKLGRDLIRGTGPRSPVVMVAIHDCTTVATGAGYGILAGTNVEQAACVTV